ncbi:hypothetical protein POM88_019695 [Heracleum sosnowskyi]|uniref:Uncharacterized protein n=1 Tax=Heracleum sosnowskyi TaxID=360622 RepID=A0AAD8MMG5_9APIA|nr:hypothetical protein POM88_019687 [Heracleum sosnowskyi]KAK1381956.1 hypothetical protein POM88_019691 [Heracleum sosnowskyi]KAK1381960.1 hypothetical protein POM88_019695 [Heracleum sosnowskyi]
MCSLESSTDQGGENNNEASSQPNVTNEVVIEPDKILQQEKDDINLEMLETKLTNQVIEPMRTGNDKETATSEANVVTPGEVKTKTRGVPDDVGISLEMVP